MSVLGKLKKITEQQIMPVLPEIEDCLMMQREMVSPLGAKFDGPYQVLLTTNTSVLLKRNSWYSMETLVSGEAPSKCQNQNAAS